MSPSSATPPVPPSPPSPGAGSPGAGGSKPVRRRGEKWKRRLKITGAVVLILAVVLRLALGFLMPTVMRSIAHRYGLTCEYDRMELSVMGGDVGIWGLKLRAPTGGEPLISADYLRAKIYPWALFRGHLRVERAEADAAEVRIEREASGRIPIMECLAAAPRSAPATSTGDGKVDLTAPLSIHALRVSRLKAHLLDRGVVPSVDVQVVLDVRVSNLGEPGATSFETILSADRLVDQLHLAGEATASGRNIDAHFELLVNGLRLKPAAGYIAPWGIVPTADEVSARLTGDLHAVPVAGSATGVTGKLTLQNAEILADRVGAFELERMVLDIADMDYRHGTFSKLAIDGFHVRTGRNGAGNLRFAGFDFKAPVASPQVAAKAAAGGGHAGSMSAGASFDVALHELSIHGFHAGFDDEAVSPAAHVALNLDELTAKSLDDKPFGPETTIAIAGQGDAPGLLRAFHLSGTFHPLAEVKRLQLAIDGQGLKPEGFASYLAGAGLESEYRDGAFAASVDGVLNTSMAGRLGADLHLTAVHLQDGAKELLSLSDVRFAGVTYDLGTGATHADAVEISGPSLILRREASGALSALGLRTMVGGVGERRSDGATKGGGAAARGAMAVPHFSLPIVDIGHFLWKGVNIRVEDAAAAVPTDVAITDAGMDIKDFRIGALSEDAGAKAGVVHAWLNAPGLVGTMVVDGQVRPWTHGFSADVKVTGDGLNASLLAPYLKPLGVEPTLRQGTLRAQASVMVADQGDGLHAGVTARGVQYNEGPTELAAIDGMEVRAVLTPGQLTIDRLAMDHPRAAVSRDADGSLRAGGMHVLAIERAGVAGRGVDRGIVSTTQGATGVAAAPVILLKDFVIDHALLAWSDHAVAIPVETTATISGEVKNLLLGRDGPQASVDLTLALRDTVGAATVKGQVLLGPAKQAAQLQIAASGLRVGVLASYLPAGVRVALREGSATMALDAVWGRNADGGNEGHFNFGNMTVRDGGATLLSLDGAEIAVTRFDLANKIVSLDHITSSALRGSVHRTADGALHVGGMVLGGAGAAVAPPGGPVAASAVAGAPAVFVAGGARDLPLVHIGKVDLHLAELAYTDDARPREAAAVVLEDFHLRSLAAIDCLGRDAATLPAVQLELSGKVAPILEEIKATTKLGPFARDPYMDLVFAVKGLHGDGLLAVVPELKTMVDASGLTDGEITAHVHAKVHLDRRSPVEFDLSQPFTGSVFADRMAFRALPGGPVLVGLEEIRADEIQVTPAEKLISVRLVEITKPTLHLTQESDGFHVLGMVVRLPQAGATQASTKAVAGSTTMVVGARAAEAGPVGEIAIHKLVISGLDASFIDHTANPPLVIPLTGMELEAHGVSSRALAEARPIRYNLLLNAGPVSLLESPEAGLVVGAASTAPASMPGVASTLPATTEMAAAEPATGPAALAAATEPGVGTGGPSVEAKHDLFAQVAGAGRLTLYPKPNGWGKISVTGLELAGLRGLAHKYGDTLSRGLFDGTVTVRFREDGSGQLNARLVVTDLALKEAPGGPIAQFFGVGAIDMVIAGLQDADGSITIPLDLPIKQNRIAMGDIYLDAMGAMTQVMVVAAASAPLKMAAAMGKMMGIEGKKKPTKLPPVVLAFAPGSSAYDAQSVSRVEQVIRDLQADEHLSVVVQQQFGQDDILRVKERANPSVDEARAIVTELRRKRADLTHLQSEVAGEARGELAAGVAPAVTQATLTRLAAIEREMAQTDDALDSTSDLLRPGADRQANRRTRAAALQLAKERIGVIKTAFNAANLPGASTRVIISPAAFTVSPGPTGQIVISVTRQR